MLVHEKIFNSPKSSPSAELQYMIIEPDEDDTRIHLARELKGPIKDIKGEYVGQEIIENNYYYVIWINGTRNECKIDSAIELLLPVNQKHDLKPFFREVLARQSSPGVNVTIVFNPEPAKGVALTDVNTLLSPDTFHQYPEKIIIYSNRNYLGVN
ncbi:MAG: hypothetical protein V2B20_06250 [Pseudomonadota bacterium]